MIALIGIAVLAAGFTFILGWWGVAVVAIGAGIVFSEDGGRPWRVALAGLIGWVLLLLLDMMSGRFVRLTTAVSGSMKIPSVALLVVTLLLPGLLGWSAAIIGAAIGQVVKSSRRRAADVT